MFISEALGGTKSPLESIREYFVDEFFKDHCSQFYVVNSGKKPIYWLIESGKKNGFKCLIYYNRYEKDHFYGKSTKI